MLQRLYILIACCACLLACKRPEPGTQKEMLSGSWEVTAVMHNNTAGGSGGCMAKGTTLKFMSDSTYNASTCMASSAVAAYKMDATHLYLSTNTYGISRLDNDVMVLTMGAEGNITTYTLKHTW